MRNPPSYMTILCKIWFWIGSIVTVVALALTGFIYWGFAEMDRACSGRPLPWYFELVDKLTTRRPD